MIHPTDTGAHGLAEWRTRHEVAQSLGVTPKRVQQLETELIRALRWAPGARRQRARRLPR